MKKLSLPLGIVSQAAALLAAAIMWPQGLQAQTAPEPQVLYNPSEDTDGSFLKKWNCEIQDVEHNGTKLIQMTYGTKVEYPTVSFPPPEGPWVLSDYAGVETEVTNTGEHPVLVSLRVDNKKTPDIKGEPYNTESVRLAPGETKTLRVYFGKSFGYKPGYALDPSMVSAIQIFPSKPKEAGTILINKVQAFGAAGDAPGGAN
jgi:hypothetical protein